MQSQCGYRHIYLQNEKIHWHPLPLAYSPLCAFPPIHDTYFFSFYSLFASYCVKYQIDPLFSADFTTTKGICFHMHLSFVWDAYFAEVPFFFHILFSPVPYIRARSHFVRRWDIRRFCCRKGRILCGKRDCHPPASSSLHPCLIFANKIIQKSNQA